MIVVQIARNFKDIDVCLPDVEKLAKTICSRFNISEATISVVVTGDAEIRKLNKRFLNSDRSTDCLSFDLSDDGNRKSEIGNRKLFEVIVNAERAVSQAELRGHSSQAELALYVTHGLLHNLGFSDSRRAQAKKMHDTEDEILTQLGYGLVYNKR